MCNHHAQLYVWTVWNLKHDSSIIYIITWGCGVSTGELCLYFANIEIFVATLGLRRFIPEWRVSEHNHDEGKIHAWFPRCTKNHGIKYPSLRKVWRQHGYKTITSVRGIYYPLKIKIYYAEMLGSIAGKRYKCTCYLSYLKKLWDLFLNCTLCAYWYKVLKGTKQGLFHAHLSNTISPLISHQTCDTHLQILNDLSGNFLLFFWSLDIPKC